jgi:hypothetical protein
VTVLKPILKGSAILVRKCAFGELSWCGLGLRSAPTHRRRTIIDALSIHEATQTPASP